MHPHRRLQQAAQDAGNRRRAGAGAAGQGLTRAALEHAQTHRVCIHHLHEAGVDALSGGQRQRVAIGRAMVRGPEVFLFDEPLSNLDAELRVEMRVEIARMHRQLGATMIYVTHDQVEAMTLADRIVVLRAGRVEQSGRPLDLYRDPDNRFVAGFLGSPAMNFLAGRRQGDGIGAPGLSASPLGIPLPATLAGGAPATVGLRPQHLRLIPGDSHVVEMTEALGGVTYVHVLAQGGEKLVVEHRVEQIPRRGDRVGLGFDPGQAMLFDPATGLRLRASPAA